MLCMYDATAVCCSFKRELNLSDGCCCCTGPCVSCSWVIYNFGPLRVHNLTFEGPTGMADLWSSCFNFDKGWPGVPVDLTIPGNFSMGVRGSDTGSLSCSGTHTYTIDEAYAGPQTVNISVVGTTRSANGVYGQVRSTPRTVHLNPSPPRVQVNLHMNWCNVSIAGGSGLPRPHASSEACGHAKCQPCLRFGVPHTRTA